MALNTSKFAPLYKYRPLDDPGTQIRLLYFNRHGEAMRCVLNSFNMDTLPKYRALSYTWGPVAPKMEISIGNERLVSRENLFAFLQKFVDDPLRDETLWIDQLSIDQSNLQERNAQVQLMSKTYKQADGVIVWLGGTKGPESRSDPCSRSIPKSQWTYAQMGELLRVPYFHRIWIIQEFLLSRKSQVLLRGPAQISLKAIIDFARSYHAVSGQANVAKSTLTLIGVWVEEYSLDQRGLLYLIDRFSRNQCTDLRDKVYGFLGLTASGFKLRIDYSLPVEDVYLDLVMAWYVQYRADRSFEGDLHRVYHGTLSTLGKEMIPRSNHQKGLLDMLWELWKPLAPGKPKYKGSENNAPVTAMGFRKGEEKYSSDSLRDHIVRGALDAWWFEREDKKYIFECRA
jgi:hypothetical protein